MGREFDFRLLSRTSLGRTRTWDRSVKSMQFADTAGNWRIRVRRVLTLEHRAVENNLATRLASNWHSTCDGVRGSRGTLATDAFYSSLLSVWRLALLQLSSGKTPQQLSILGSLYEI